MIKLSYHSDKPIHEQIALGIKELIISGALELDEQLPSVRELSVSLTVNPNTVQRAYKDLESEGVIYSIKGKGSFVSPVLNVNSRRIEELYDKLQSIVRELAFFGEDKALAENIIRNIYEEREDRND